MFKQMKNLFHIVLFSLCISLTGYAQELQKNFINYQGVASDASGDAITNTAIAIQIALKFGSATATASYIENHSITTDANGVFSLQIGNGSLVSGAYNATNWGTDASYITVSLNGAEVGTTEMVAVPYAMSSGDTQWTVNGTDIENKNTGAVKVLTNLEVTGNISTQTGATINEFSTDGTLTDNSDTALPTEKAVKTYLDNVTSDAVVSIDDLSDGKADTNGRSLFLGLNAGVNDDGTNNNNVGVGYQALISNTTGFSNTANGYQALRNNIDGNSNVANGSSALYSNSSGSSNTAIGLAALYQNTTGYVNTANGVSALYSNISGYENTANGYQALFSNTTGIGNVALGYKAGYSETGSNKLYISNSDTSTPLIYGEFDNKILTLNGATTVNESTNSTSTYALSGIKTHTGDNDARGVYGENTVSDYYGYGVYGKAGYTGVRGVVTPSGDFEYYGVAGRVVGGNGTNYGVYGSASGGATNYSVYASGDLAYTGALISTSDRKLKTNINKLSNSMATIMSLQPSTYSFKESYQKNIHVSNKPQFGFMAQELQAVLPELVSENKHPGANKEDPEISYLGINYIGLIPILTAGIQEQQEQIITLEAKIESQNQTIQSLISRIEVIENR